MSLASSASAMEEVLRRIPTFAAARSRDDSYISYDDDSPYLVYGDLGVFEPLAGCPDCITLTRRMLSKDAVKLFDRVLKGWI